MYKLNDSKTIYLHTMFSYKVVRAVDLKELFFIEIWKENIIIVVGDIFRKYRDPRRGRS